MRKVIQVEMMMTIMTVAANFGWQRRVDTVVERGYMTGTEVGMFGAQSRFKIWLEATLCCGRIWSYMQLDIAVGS